MIGLFILIKTNNFLQCRRNANGLEKVSCSIYLPLSDINLTNGVIKDLDRRVLTIYDSANGMT